MGQFVSILVFGISYGLILFLVATGMTLTMGLLRVVNMSHGAIYLFAGYFGVWFYKITGNWVLSAIACAVVGALLGLIIERGFLRRLYKSPTNQVLLTIGFIHILTNVTQWIWGGAPAGAPIPPFLSTAVPVGNVTIQFFRFFIIIFGVIIAFALWYMQEKTKIGAMVRAGMDNGEIAGAMGLNNKKMFTFVFVLGSLIAGLSGVIGGVYTGLDMNTGWNVLLNSIIVVVVGGAGSIQGALVGGLLLGLVNAFGQAYFPALSSYLFYIVLIVILVVRPQGLMGRKVDVNKADDNYSAQKTVLNRLFNPATLDKGFAAKHRTGLTVYRFFPYFITLVLLIVLPTTVKSLTGMISKVLVYALFAMSLDVVMGYTGNRSFGHAAFFGMGGYVVGLLCTHFGITSFWLVLPITIIVCAVLAAIIGYFTLRLTGTNFLLVTMAFGQLLGVIAQKWYKVTGGQDGLVGISRPDFNFVSFKWTDIRVYLLILVIFLICYCLLHRFMRSSFGQTLKGIRGNEGRMRSLGYNTWAMRYTGVIIAGVFAGIAGLLYAYLYKTVVPNMFQLETSALPMLMIIMGGGATLWGPALGAAVIVLVQNYAGVLTTDRWPLILGGLYVVCVMFLPGGFAPLLQRFWDWVGSKLFSKSLKEETACAKADEEVKL